MRASSLSNKQVIELLGKHFVPVFVAKDDSRELQPCKTDLEELARISRECRQRSLDAGTVCVYIVHPDGSMLATQMVQKASKPENLIPLLKDIIAKEKVEPRQSGSSFRAATLRKKVQPKTDDGVILHVYTRFDGNRANYGLSEDWVELTADEWAAFLPKEGSKTGASWPVPEKVAEKLFRTFFPPGPNWDARQGQVRKAALTATLTTGNAKSAELALRGQVELSYPFAGPDTDGKVTAKLVGVVRTDARRKALTTFALVSEDAQFVWQWQGKPQPERMAIAVELEAR